MFLYNIWYMAALSNELKPGKILKKVITGEPLALGRDSQGKVFAIRDVCPHRAAPLSAGQIKNEKEQTCVECPYHGWKFRVTDGACTEIPALTECQKASFETEKIRVRTYPLCEQDGLIWIYISSDKRMTDMPETRPIKLRDSFKAKPRLIERDLFHCHIDHAIVGLMDPAHGPYVHQQWWWRTETSIHEKEKAFEPRDKGFAMLAHQPSKNSFMYKILGGSPMTEIVFRLPGIRTETIQIGKQTILSLTALTPVTEEETEIYQVFFWDYALNLGKLRFPVLTLLSPIFKPMVKAFLTQDRRMVDLQQSGLKVQKRLMLIDDADKQAKWYKQLQDEWVASQQEKRPFVNPVKPCKLRWRS